MVQHWAGTQKAVTLSSGEVELAGVVKGAREGLGIRSIALDLGRGLELWIHTDLSAAQGICSGSGIGKVRHLAVSQLWVQESLKDRACALFEVRGEVNPAYLMTKHIEQAKIAQHSGAMALRSESGRAVAAPKLAAGVEPFLAPVAPMDEAPRIAGPASVGVGRRLCNCTR